jgi:hypothetical protein
LVQRNAPTCGGLTHKASGQPFRSSSGAIGIFRGYRFHAPELTRPHESRSSGLRCPSSLPVRPLDGFKRLRSWDPICCGWLARQSLRLLGCFSVLVLPAERSCAFEPPEAERVASGATSHVWSANYFSVRLNFFRLPPIGAEGPGSRGDLRLNGRSSAWPA